MELLGVETDEDAVAGKHKVLRTECARAAVLVIHQGVELRQVGAAHEGRVGNGEQHRHRRSGRLLFVGIELYPLQVCLVLEGFLGKGHRAVGGE